MRTPGAVVGPVMPRVTGTWGHERWCEARGVPDPLPCPGHWAYYTGTRYRVHTDVCSDLALVAAAA